ncbi:hypothetical protein OnM2_029077 [Erysiphe neolycopersici]|uniref:Uncharacterized protein n=1 Tax=Erysiphe neolycopersici TaxID=212602 RepID=A0A420HZP6_9PEZI|nr:hypothetical protein OnM2_029077 [Erysiphe neolycopersici]
MSVNNNSWTIETLSKTNHEKWFRLMKAKIQSKGVMHVLQMSMEEYSVVDAPDARLAENNNSLEEITSSINVM